MSNQYALSTTKFGVIEYRPCCQYTGERIALDDRENFIKAREFFNNTSGWIPGCNSCKHMEQSNVHSVSYRAQSFTRTASNYDHNECVSLDITLDLECNAACIVCGPHTSSTWAKLEGKDMRNNHVAYSMTKFNPQKDLEKYNNQFQIQLDSSDTAGSDVYLRQIIKYIPVDKLEILLLKGGEPFLTDFHKKLMTYIISVHPNPKQIVIRYNTNCSVFPDAEVLELWKHFKEIRLNLSLDAIGKQFNYIRWPLKWNKVEKIVKRFITETDAKFVVQCTINPLNLLYHAELCSWAEQNIPLDRTYSKSGVIAVTRCYGNLDLSYVPRALTNESINMYGEDHEINKILKTFTVENRNIESMIKFLEKHDKIRSENWRETFPLVVPFLS